MSFEIGKEQVTLEEWARRQIAKLRDELEATPRWRVLKRLRLSRRLRESIRSRQILETLAKSIIQTQPAPRKWFSLDG